MGREGEGRAGVKGEDGARGKMSYTCMELSYLYRSVNIRSMGGGGWDRKGGGGWDRKGGRRMG